MARHIRSGEWFDINDESARLLNNAKQLKKDHKADPEAQILKATMDEIPSFGKDRRWPSNGYLGVQMAQLEKHMRYYSVNYADLDEVKKRQQNSLSSSLVGQNRYLAYVVEHTKKKIGEYVNHMIRQLLFEGKTVRNLTVNLECDSQYDNEIGSVIYSISKIGFEKCTKQRGSIQKNIMRFTFDNNGNIEDRVFVCESLPKNFNQENLEIIEENVMILMERFNCSVAALKEQIYQRSPEAKAKIMNEIGEKNKQKFFSHFEKLSSKVN